MLSASDCLKAVGCSARRDGVLGVEVPGPQRPKGVVGQGQIGPRSEHLGPRSSDEPTSLLDHVRHLGIHLECTAEIERPRHPQPPQRPRKRRSERRTRCAEGQRSPRVRSGQHRQQQGDVRDVACQRPAHRRRLPLVGQRPLRHPPERRPHPDHAAERRRVAQRATHVGAVGQGHHPGSQRRGRSPARAPGRLGAVDGVASGAVDAVERVRARGELRRVRLAEEYDARPPDAFDDQLVGGRDVRGEDRGAVRRPPARHVMGVLDRERQPVERTERRPGGEVLVGGSSTRARPVDVERHDRVEVAVALIDALEVQLEQLARRDPPFPHRRRPSPARSTRPRARSSAHRRRPKTEPAITPSSTRPAPTAIPFTKSLPRPPAGLAGAVNTPSVVELVGTPAVETG